MIEKKVSIYDRIGGEEALVAAVAIFYEKVLNDPVLKKYFVGVDMVSLVTHQRNFLRAALGGKIPYTGKGLQLAHKRLHLNDTHFTQVAHHLVQTLKELNVPQDIISEIVAIVMSVKNDIVEQQKATATATSPQKPSGDKTKKCPFSKLKSENTNKTSRKTSFYEKLLITGMSTSSLFLALYVIYLVKYL